MWANPSIRAVLNLALAVAAGTGVARGLIEGEDYLGDGRWGYAAFVFGPFVIVVCAWIAGEALRERFTGRPPGPPPRALWGAVAAAYATLGLALLL